MDSSGEISLLCRLCLVKEQVNVPIFGENGDIRQIFLKISSCLPVKVSKEDPLPKNICEGCSDKLDSLYTFWNTSRDAEKTLLSWLQQAQVDNADEAVSAISKQISAQSELVKEETELTQDVSIKEDNDETGAPPAKRARRTAAVKAQISISQEESEEEDDVDEVEPLTKVEDESDMSDNDGTDDQPLSTFVDMPGTSVDEEQAGPSGVGKEAADAPSRRLSPHSSPFHQCPSCKRQQFKTTFSLKKHLLNCAQYYWPRPPQYKCPLCPKTFKRKQEIQRHQIVRHTDKLLRRQYACDICQKTFLEQSRVENHKRREHLKDFRFHCEVCGKGHISVGELNHHVKSIHQQGEPQLFPCTHPGCNKVFRKQTSLKYHQYTHLEVKPTFICDKCGLTFNHPVSYSKHLRKHNEGPKVYTCQVCDKAISTLASLTDHMRVHSGEKPFICEHCGKAFRTKAILRVHLVVHTKEKRHVCKVCGKAFTQRSPLKAHLVRVHKIIEEGKLV